jgi:apolipoprotein N-acyltransferase
VRRALVGAVAAGLLTVLALSPRGFHWLAWGALVPLLVPLADAGRGATLAAAVVYAVVLALVGLEPWIARASAGYFGLAPWRDVALTAVPLALLSAGHGAVLGLLLLGRPGRPGPWAVIWTSAAWTCWEMLRTVVLPYYPAAILGISQYTTLPVLQVVSLTGVAGLTFVLTAVNVGLAGLIVSPGRRGAAAALTGLVLAGAVTGWGARRMREAEGEPAPGPTVAAVDLDARSAVAGTLDRYVVASRAAVAAHPALVVWPESALVSDLERDPAAWATVNGLATESGIPVLAGGPGSARRDGPGFARFNSAHLVSPGRGLRSYHKRGLVPFAERWPTFAGAPPPDLASLDPGPDATVFPLGDSAFGVLICFEIIDAHGARDLARAGARFIVNITNDVWFAGAPRPPHLPWAAIRAVEVGLPVVRAANAGPSGVFDRLGRLRQTRSGAGLLVATVPAAEPTFYARHGDLFLAGCLALVLAGLVTGSGTPARTHRAEWC